MARRPVPKEAPAVPPYEAMAALGEQDFVRSGVVICQAPLDTDVVVGEYHRGGAHGKRLRAVCAQCTCAAYHTGSVVDLLLIVL